MTKILNNPFTLLGVTLISVVFSISLYKSAQKTNYSTENLKSIEEEVAVLEEEVAMLETAIVESQQPFAKEEIIRNELLMKKPGEYIIQIPDELIENSQEKTKTERTSPWEEWRKLLLTKSHK